MRKLAKRESPRRESSRSQAELENQVERLAFCNLGWFFLAVLVLSSSSGCHRKSAPEIVYIGHVASFRGPDKFSGDHARQGILLALEEAQGTEDTIGENRRVEVINVDSEGDLKSVEPKTVRLVAVNHVAALLGGTDWAYAEAMIPVAQSNEIPLLVTGGLSGRSTPAYVFHTGLSPDRQAEALADFACNHHAPPIKKMAVLVDGVDKGPSSFLAGKFTREFLKKEGNSLAGEWTYKEYHKGAGGAESEWSFKSAEELNDIVEQVRSRHPDGILMVGSPGDLARLRKAGLDEKLPLFFAGENGSEGVLRGISSGQTVFLATGFVLDQNEKQNEFASRYEKRFHEPPDVHAAFAYENMKILLDVLTRVSSPKGAKIQEALENLKEFPALSGTVSFDKDHHWADCEAFVVRLQDGRVKVEYPPKGKE
jgi:branched-chain amino acid transport system substrate-binding protein